MPTVHRIRITNGFSDGSLRLSDGGETRGWQTDFIRWEIDKNTVVASIERIVIKNGSPNIFRELPHANGMAWSAEIDHRAFNGAICRYSIFWVHTDGTHKVFDPIIAIRPRPYLDRDTLLNVLTPAVTFLVGVLAGFIYWRKDRMRLNIENERLKMNG